MYSKLFEKIYFEYRLKPLVEQALREAEINQKITIKKTSVYRKWYAGLKDEKLRVIIRIRLSRLKKGLFGEIRAERGVSELFIDYGPGYRVYFTQSKKTVVISLCGGDKSTQDEDIELANNIGC
jgi:putative addiction module killer protein